MWLERLSSGGTGLITLEDAKDHLRILDDEVNGEVQVAINTATSFLDVDVDGFGGLGFPIVAQQWSLKASSFAAENLQLPFTQVNSIDAINVHTPAGAAVVPPANYTLIGRGRLREVSLIVGESWPELADRPDAVDIRFTAGFADLAAVPDDIKAAARLLVGHYFHNRSAVIEGTVSSEISLGVERLVGRYRRFAM